MKMPLERLSAQQWQVSRSREYIRRKVQLRVLTGLSGLFGTPIAGQLVGYGYIALACWAGATLLAGTVILACSRLYQDRSLTARI
jgi:hypothetical protein